jgi:hypothetical protein
MPWDATFILTEPAYPIPVTPCHTLEVLSPVAQLAWSQLDASHTPEPTLEGLKVMELITNKGYKIGNIDTTVVCQKPKIMPYADDMRSCIAKICNIKEVFPDDKLYAGGISLMGKNQFLNPHLDNSHDKDREKWRVLNLLYYVTPDWDIKNKFSIFRSSGLVKN